jgi:PPOX class probable F420-dependent enzyme
MAAMTQAERDAFLAGRRFGILSMLREDGSPLAVPVWYEWDGRAARMFTSGLSPKIKRLEADARVSLLVINDVDEPEAWVALDGEVVVREQGGLELALRLAPRYWDLADEQRKQTLELWRKAAAVFRVLELTPTRARSFKDG